jgi:hypothetical protein
MGLNRQVRGIGLQDQGSQRQGAGQGTQAMGAFEGQHTAKTELEAKVQVVMGLLKAAVKGMGDPASNPDAT